MTTVSDPPPAECVAPPSPIDLDIYVLANEKLQGAFNICVSPHIEIVPHVDRADLEQRAKELKRLQDQVAACPSDQPELLQRAGAERAQAAASYFEAKNKLEAEWREREQTRERSLRAVETLKLTSSQIFPDLLGKARAEFFETGPGAVVLERKKLLLVAEQALVACQKELAELRTRWRVAVNADHTSEIEKLEKSIDVESKKELRLAARIPVLKAELEASRKAAAPLLEPMLLKVREQFIAAAKVEVTERLAELRAVVPEPFLDYLRALCKLEGGIGSSPLIGQLRELKE